MKLLCYRIYILIAVLSVVFVSAAFLPGCTAVREPADVTTQNLVVVNTRANHLEERFAAPAGFVRTTDAEHSFARYLRNLPLKPHGAKVKYYDGRTKERDVYEAVVDLDVGARDLQQCADAVIRLRAEYLFNEKRYADIRFNFTNGFAAEYVKWRDGYRIAVRGNEAGWVKTAGYSAEYSVFRTYLDTVFAYAGTLSLSKELLPRKISEMQIGDVFIQGGSPGHCVMVVDMAYNPQTGKKIFMLAQSYMPAQDIHILKNYGQEELSPWYSEEFEELKTPEWTFRKEDLRAFPAVLTP